MWHLFRTELIRFRTLGLVLGVGVLALLRWSMIFGPLYHYSEIKLLAVMVVCLATGLTFGLYQMSSHMRPGRWAFLVHRPLAPAKILAALAGAGAAWLTGVLGVPMLLITLYADLATPQWVDLRHYGMIPFVVGVALTFYGVGVAARSSPSRLAPLFGVLPLFFFTDNAVSWWVVVPLIGVLIWLAALAAVLFKPDLGVFPRGAGRIALAALPIQYAVWGILGFGVLLLYSTVVAFQEHGWRSYAAMAWNDYFPLDSIESLGSYRSSSEVLELGLGWVDGERAEALQRQIALAEVFEMRPSIPSFPRRHEPVFAHVAYPLVDEEREEAWTFAHDPMQFQGRHLRTGAPVGWLGPDGHRPTLDGPSFENVPLVAGDRFLITTDTIWEVDLESRRVAVRYRLAEGERLATSPRAFGSVLAVLSDRALYLFDRRTWEERLEPVEPSARLDLAGSIDNLARISAAELIDGHVVAFVFGAHSDRGIHPAFEHLVEVTVAGDVAEVGRVPLVHGPPDVVRHRGFILSPLIQTAHDLIWSWIAPLSPTRVGLSEVGRQALSTRVLLAALLLSTLAAALTWVAATRRRLTAAERLAWTLVAFGCGLPAWITMLASTPRPESIAATEARRPRMAGGVAAVGGGVR